MVDYKTRETIFSFLVPSEKELIPFFEKFLNSDFIDEYEVVYSNIIKDKHPEIFKNNNNFLLDDPLNNLIEALNSVYLNKRYFTSASKRIVKETMEKFPNTNKDFIYLNSILMSISFRLQPLYNFSHKNRDQISKKQEAYYGITNEIEMEKDENTANSIIDIYFGWIDLRAQNITNEFRNSKLGYSLPKGSIIVDVYVKSDFLALFEFVFNLFELETGFKLIEVPIY